MSICIYSKQGGEKKKKDCDIMQPFTFSKQGINLDSSIQLIYYG